MYDLRVLIAINRRAAVSELVDAVLDNDATAFAIQAALRADVRVRTGEEQP